jgi:hypothetical protein
MRFKARLAVSLAAVAVAAYGFGPLPGVTHAGATGSPSQYVFTPNVGTTQNPQFANPGSLTTTPVTVTLTVEDSLGQPVTNATVYLALTNSSGSTGGTAQVLQCGASTSLGSTAVPCTSGATTGTVSITYTPPGTPPTGGYDRITATNVGTGTPAISAFTSYFFTTVTHYSFGTAAVIADAGSLTAGSSQKFTVTPENAAGATVASASYWVNFTTTGPGGVGGTLVDVGSATTCPNTGTTINSSFQKLGPGPQTFCYTSPASSPVVDTMTVQDTQAQQDVRNVAGYNTTAPTDVQFSPASPFAPAGSLAADQPVNNVVHPVNGTTPVAFAEVTLSIGPVPSTANSGNPWGSASAGGIPLTSAEVVASDANGSIPTVYTAASPLVNSGTDDVHAFLTNHTAKTTDNYYNYATVAAFQLTPNTATFAARGSLGNGGTAAPITLAADDGLGNPIAHTSIFMKFSQTTNGGQVTVTGANSVTTSFTATSSTWTPVSTMNDGTVSISFTAGGAQATGGFDELLMQDTSNATPAVTATLSYAYGPVDHFAFNPTTPIAATGTLNPADQVPVQITEIDGGGSTLTGTAAVPMYLSYQKATGGGTVSSPECSGAITATPVKCTPGADGVVSVTYTAPTPLPAGGMDALTVGDAGANPNNPATDSYSFVGNYAPASGAIATAGSLVTSQHTQFNLTVEDSSLQPAPGAGVWLSFAGAGAATANGTALTSSPQLFTSDGSGHVLVGYTSPASLPAGGTDVITAQNAQSSPTLSRQFSYTFTGAYTLSPSGPNIAPAATLAGGTMRTITASVLDSQGHALPGGRAYASLSAAAGGGSATIGGTPLGSTPQLFTADNSGHLSIHYMTPSTLPSSGTDVLVVQNMLSSPTLTITDVYKYAVQGYWLVATDGGIFSFGLSQFHGSTGNIHLNQPIVGMTSTPDHAGYWMVASDGGIFSFGDAMFHGSTGNIHLNKPIVGMATTPSGNGYWLVASDGGIFSFGDATFHGSTGNIQLNQPIVGMASTPSGKGYWLVASDGGIFSFGDATFHGSTGNIHLNKPIVGMATTPSGAGYWFVASDGGIFTFGDATFHNSAGNLALVKPIVGMAATQDGGGYWMVASDGGIFAFGDAHFLGSMGGTPLNQPIVGMASIG